MLRPEQVGMGLEQVRGMRAIRLEWLCFREVGCLMRFLRMLG